MTRPRASTVLRRFLDGEQIGITATWLFRTHDMPIHEALDYVEHCIRRGLRGEVKVPRTSRRRRSSP